VAVDATAEASCSARGSSTLRANSTSPGIGDAGGLAGTAGRLAAAMAGLHGGGGGGGGGRDGRRRNLRLQQLL